LSLRKTMGLILLISLLIFLTGCNSSLPVDQNNPPVKPAKTGVITDPAELEKLWQEYIYDGIYTIYNTRNFQTAEEIDPANIGMFCWFKYIAEHGTESLKTVETEKQGTVYLFPLETVLEYSQRYFNLSSLDVAKVEDYYYDAKRNAFTFSFGRDNNRPSYKDRNAFGIDLDKVIKNDGGTITVNLVRYHDYGTRRVELTQTYTLKQRPDGSYYYVTGRWDYVNNNLVALTGDYQRFDQIAGFDGDYHELSLVGEVRDKLVLVHTPYAKGKKAQLLLINPETMTVEKKLDFEQQFGFGDIRESGEKYFVLLPEKVVIVNRSLIREQEIPLPEQIIAKANRQIKYDRNGKPDVVFGGYDVTRELNQFVYSDEEGLKLLDPATGNERLLAETVAIPESKLSNYSYHWNPRFVADDSKVISTMTGYECIRGYTLCDLTNGTAKHFNLVSEGQSSMIRFDTGLLEINIPVYDQDQGSTQSKTYYLEFKTGELKEVQLADSGETGEIRGNGYNYVGQNFAAFITNKRDLDDNANDMFYLNLLDLQKLEVQPQVISVKAAEPYLIGVLGDGRILFSYNLNPSENGICLTKKLNF